MDEHSDTLVKTLEEMKSERCVTMLCEALEDDPEDYNYGDGCKVVIRYVENAFDLIRRCCKSDTRWLLGYVRVGCAFSVFVLYGTGTVSLVRVLGPQQMRKLKAWLHLGLTEEENHAT